MTDSSSNSACAATLTLSRLLYAGAARKAARTVAALRALQACAIFVPRAEALSRVAQAIFYSARYDACERYETIEEFEEALIEDLDQGAERVTRNGVDCYALRPFLCADTSLLGHLGLGYFGGYATASDFTGLDVAESALYASTETVSGLTDTELEWLQDAYRRKTLTLVNLLRKLTTAMAYVHIALRNEATKPSLFSACEREGDFAAAAAALSEACHTDFTPAPAGYFGTEADRINPLRQLPTDTAQLGCLLQA